MSEATTLLLQYLTTLEDSERRRQHDEREGWECVPVSEVANNMAGLASAVRKQVLDEFQHALEKRATNIVGEELWSIRAYEDVMHILDELK